MAAGGSITIRGHHLLCMLGFEGLGYSPAFIRNLEEIIRLLSESDDTSVFLTTSCDAICDACPHQDGGACAKPGGEAAKAAAWDDAVLEKIAMPPGTLTTVREVYKQVAQRVAEDDIGTSLCADCQWLDLGCCKAGLARLNATGSAFALRWKTAS